MYSECSLPAEKLLSKAKSSCLLLAPWNWRGSRSGGIGQEGNPDWDSGYLVAASVSTVVAADFFETSFLDSALRFFSLLRGTDWEAATAVGKSGDWDVLCPAATVGVATDVDDGSFVVGDDDVSLPFFSLQRGQGICLTTSMSCLDDDTLLESSPTLLESSSVSTPVASFALDEDMLYYIHTITLMIANGMLVHCISKDRPIMKSILAVVMKSRLNKR